MKFTIEGELTDLNSYIAALNGSRYGGNGIKQSETQRVAYQARQAKLPAATALPVHITYVWYSKDRRKDTDNVAFAKKFINDGLVLAGVLPDDSRNYVAGFTDWFEIDRARPRVEVSIELLRN